MPKKGFTHKRANFERRYCSEYCLLTYPDDTIKLNVPLGTAPDGVIKELGLYRALRQFRAYRPEADAIIIRNNELVLIETKIINALAGLAKLPIYRDLISYTPELADFYDLPVRAVLVTAKPPLWFIRVAKNFDVEYVIYAPEWLSTYYKRQDEYLTLPEKVKRAKRREVLDQLGFGEDL